MLGVLKPLFYSRYGFCPNINNILAVDLNFTIKYVEPEDNKYGGHNNATGAWNGMIKDILDGNTDMTGNQVKMAFTEYVIPL